MANRDANYDKVVLGIAAFLSLAIAGYLYSLKTSFSEKLVEARSTPKAEFGEIPVEKVESAIGNLKTVFNWVSPVRGNKPVPLNKSIPIILKEGQLFDMFVETPALRAPMTNKFLRDYDLEYLAPNVGDLDPDGDGFSNLEEFNKQTNPKDSSNHPPVTDKLFFKERIQNSYILALQSPDLPLLVQRTEPTRGSVFVQAVPSDFGFDKGAPPRFKALVFNKKTTPEGKDVSELEVEDVATKQKFTLVYKTPFNLAEFQVKLEFRLKVVTELPALKKGETFRLPEVANTYKVIDVSEDSATISEVKDGNPGSPFVVGKRP